MLRASRRLICCGFVVFVEICRARLGRCANVASSETLEALRDYAEVLVGESGWPIVFDDFLIITSGSGGIELIFEVVDVDPGSSVASSSFRARAFASLTPGEKRAHWQTIFCRPELEALVERYGLFGGSVAHEGTNFQTVSARCFPADELTLIQQLRSTRTTLYRWQWDLSRFLDGEIEELPVDEYRQTAERIGLRDIWPLIEGESEFESRFKEWLEAQVLRR